MTPRCVRIRYKKPRGEEPVVKNRAKKSSGLLEKSLYVSSNRITAGEDWHEEYAPSFGEPVLSPCEQIRRWLWKQKFYPQDLSDDFLMFFLATSGYNIDVATDKLQKYFISRQEPSALFRNRDPLSAENVKILEKLYVMPLPETTADGRKIIITGAVQPLLSYNQLEHAKALAMVFDLLIWEKDFGFGDYVIVFDGRGFQCPQLLENKVHDHRSIRRLLQDTIPGKLRSFYFLYPPPHVARTADTRNGLWLRVIKTKQEMATQLPIDLLPLEFGGNLGHLGDLLEQWYRHIIQNREFFIEFERRMIRDYERRLCYEDEVSKRGKNWVQNMKLVEDEWEYKKYYYQRMKCMTPLKHPAYGSLRLANKIAMAKSLREERLSKRLLAEELGVLETPTESSRKNKPARPDRKGSGHCIVLPGITMNGDLEEGDFSTLKGGSTSRTHMGSQLQMNGSQIKPRGMSDANEKGRETVDTSHKESLAAENQSQAQAADKKEDEDFEERSDTDPEIDFEKELAEINNWLVREPYLPKNIDEEILITFLWEAQSVEQAEAKLMNYYYARQSLYAVFRERHPCSPNNLLKYDAVCVIPLTCGTDKNWIIFATWLSHDNPAKFSIYHMAKLIFTELDILLQENQIRGKRISVIIDMAGYTAMHTAMITKFASKRICHLFTDCFPATFNGFYIVNPPDHVADYTALFQPFDFHIVESLDDLAGFLPKKFLPSDMGGEADAPNRDSLFEPFFKRMQRCGNWLAYEELVRSQEMMLRMTTNREDFVYGPVK